MTAPRIFLGIDPGLAGAIAAITDAGALIGVLEMPTLPHGKTKRVHAVRVRQFIDDALHQTGGTVALALLEQVASRPRQSSQSVFTFGRAFGAVEAVLSGMQLPLDYITPSAWKKQFGLTRFKGDSVTKALDLMPEMESWRAGRGPTHDQAEAVLLAELARRRWGGNIH